MTRTVTTARMPIHLLAAGGVAAGARPLREVAASPPRTLDADAQPVPLRVLTAEAAPEVSRMASRFSQLAALGVADCLRGFGEPLPAETRVYLATGLGDVAHTDALYYGVMPPQCEMPPPARFAASGNNMAALFVAQHAGLRSRNLTLAQAELSFECALEVALSDLAEGATRTALVGGVDETTLPREFYTRRFHVGPDQAIGEGSAWLVLDNSALDESRPRLGTLLGARVMTAPAGRQPVAWIDRTREAVEQFAVGFDHSIRLSIAGGTRVNAAERDALVGALRPRWPDCAGVDYLQWSGRFPTAAALLVAAFVCGGIRPMPARRLFAHVNRDSAGRMGLIVFEAG
jgi:hypothetical protein